MTEEEYGRALESHQWHFYLHDLSVNGVLCLSVRTRCFFVSYVLLIFHSDNNIRDISAYRPFTVITKKED